MTPTLEARLAEKLELQLVEGVEGPSIYLNGYRIAGPKPWGGGRVVRTWKTTPRDVLEAVRKYVTDASGGGTEG
jgi:hypothetical protein